MKILPHVGVGPLRFGMTSKEVALATGFAADKRWPADFGFGTEERIRELLLRVQYDTAGRAVSFAFNRGDRRLKPVDLVYDDLRLISRKLGLSMYAPMLSVLAPDECWLLSEDWKPGQGFHIFRPGLYEEQRELIERFQG